MQNVITSAFETVTTVEGGVELLDIFMHLSGREVSVQKLLLTQFKGMFLVPYFDFFLIQHNYV